MQNPSSGRVCTVSTDCVFLYVQYCSIHPHLLMKALLTSAAEKALAVQLKVIG